MIEELRREFNRRWTPESYERLLARVKRIGGEMPGFRIAETPCFLPSEMLGAMCEVGRELTGRLLGNPEYVRASTASIPARYRVYERESAMPVAPNFMTADFGFVRETTGELSFRLVELQAFPSVFGFQDELVACFTENYRLAPELTGYLGGHDHESYWRLLRDVIVAGHDPAEVVLLEVTPEQQKTRVDFRVYERRLGIRTVDIAKVRQSGRRLEYERDGRWVPIRRVFNRAIADEMERMGVQPGFPYGDELEVEWAGHPNWYFKASKFSLPYLDHWAVPRAVFLDRWMDDQSLLPAEREQMLLKPLFSFAGKGITFGPTDEQLRAIPAKERSSYLLQERVRFQPVIETPSGPTQAEVRIMMVARDGEELAPVISMVRLGRGLMMGVDYNRDQTWVGASVAFTPKCA